MGDTWSHLLSRMMKNMKLQSNLKEPLAGIAGSLQGSPFVVQMDKKANRDKNSMTGSLVMDSIRKDIAELTKFTRQTQAGLSAKVPSDNMKALVKVKEHIHNVLTQKQDIELQFDRSHAIIEYLEGEGGKMGRLMDNLKTAKQLWEQVQDLVPITKSSIAPLVKLHGAKTKADIAQYENDVAEYAQNFKNLDFWKYDAGPEGARIDR